MFLVLSPCTMQLFQSNTLLFVMCILICINLFHLTTAETSRLNKLFRWHFASSSILTYILDVTKLHLIFTWFYFNACFKAKYIYRMRYFHNFQDKSRLLEIRHIILVIYSFRNLDVSCSLFLTGIFLGFCDRGPMAPGPNIWGPFFISKGP